LWESKIVAQKCETNQEAEIGMSNLEIRSRKNPRGT
jgi:hypothetical protein